MSKESQKPAGLLSRFSIWQQILIGFLPALLIIAILAYNSEKSFGDFFTTFDRLKSETQETINILEIDNDIVEMQRAALVYSYVGYSGVLNKIELIQQRLEERLAALERALSNKGENAQSKYKRMVAHYNSYKQSFARAVVRKEKLTSLLNDNINPLAQRIKKDLDYLIAHNKELGIHDRALLISDLKSRVVQVELNVQRFFRTTDAAYMKQNKEIIRQLREDSERLAKQASQPYNRTIVERVSLMIVAYEARFIEMVNVNRGFLHLVNVVMAGQAAEIDRLSGELSDMSASNLDALHESIQGSMNLSKDEYQYLSLAAILIGLITALLVARGIARPVQAMAATLTRLAKGEADIGIPGLRRRDEVGKMAQAANEFKEMAIRLEKQTEQLIDSNEDLERFAYICSHDLQEPLRMIRSFTAKLDKHLEDKLHGDEKAERYMKYVTDGSTRAQELIADVLAYARVDQDTRQSEQLDLEHLLGVAMEGLQDSIEEKKALITYDPLPTLLGNKTQILQIFQNLLTNAIKFCENEPKIHIGAVQKGAEWEFYVKDNGIGIPKEYMDKIFVIFQRLNNKHDYPGTGIGLSICRKIVEKYGGRMWAESEVGVGSTFYFTINIRFINRGVGA